MADNSPSSGGAGDVISTDDLATINGGATSGVKVQRMKVGFGSDSDLRDVDATHGLPVSLNAAAFIFSTNNSTTAQLAAGATFTGTIEAVLDQPSLSLLLTSDQPVTITVYPLIDSGGTFAGAPIVYYANANQGFSTSLPLNCNYLRVTVKNTGTATTTTLNLSTAYGNLPSADTKGRVPVSADDCAPLLISSITATGVSSTIDTIGYQAIVVQLTGAWAGSAYFESSNSGSASEWDQIMCYTSGVPMLQEVVTSNGSYIIRPSGRYLRLKVTNITGTMGLNALGRSDIGISPADYLSLAMDSANSMPAQVQAQGSTGRPLAQDRFGVAAINNAIRPLIVTPAFKVGDVLFSMPCADMTSISVMFYNPTVAYTVAFEGFFPGGWLGLNSVSSSNGGVAGYSNGGVISCSAGAASYNIANLAGCTQVRGRITVHGGTNAITAAGYLAATAIGPTIPSVTASQTGTWTVGVSSSTPATSTAITINSAATTNATSSKASAGTLYGIACSNTGGAAAFVKLYNKASAPTVGTDVPVLTITVPASGSVQVDWGALGYRFATGIALAITNLAADTDTTAVAASQVKVTGSYI